MVASGFSIRSTLMSGGSALVGVLLATGLSNYGYPYIGWVLGGALMGVGAMFAYVPPARRSVVKWLYVLSIPGIVSAITYNLIG